MKFSINSVQALNHQYKTSKDVAKIGVDKLVSLIGSQLGEVEEVSHIGAKYQDIIIAKVVTCQKHPNADKLNVCLIDDDGVAKKVDRNKDGLVQVVCGAPNVKAGINVAWLPPGATVPDTYDDQPFVLGARELRGIVSNGMLASPKELALGDSHDGIMILDSKFKAGQKFADQFELSGDVIIDIENKMFTHRPDCFGLIGVYRELAGIQNLAFESPDWYKAEVKFDSPSGKSLPLKITNNLPELCPRFSAIVLRDVKVAASPVWLQVELAKVGIKSINNIVDYTNYFSYLTGQPLHAYDYDKLVKLSGKATPEIVVRHAKAGETIALLNGKTIEPGSEAIMIATDRQLIGIGGVMGGSESEVDNSTVNIVLESANFDMYSIRRTSMNLGLFTDAVTRFSKGQSPLQTLTVLAKIADEICKYAGGKIASKVYDSNSLPKTVISSQSMHPPITVSEEFINSRLGLDLSIAQIKKLLENVEFQIKSDAKTITVSAPFWRTDIERPEDLVEEVGRLHGYDNARLQLPLRSTKPASQNDLMKLKQQIRNIMQRAGGNEVLSYSFVHGKTIDSAEQQSRLAYKLTNALSPSLQYYRLSITPSLLDKVHTNIKAGFNHFAIYEIGKTHITKQVDDKGLPLESDVLGLTLAANSKLKLTGSAYYQAKHLLVNLAQSLQLELDFKPIDAKGQSQAIQPFDPSRSATVIIKSTKQEIGVVGEYKRSVVRNFKLPAYSAGFEIQLNDLSLAAANAPSSYSPLPKFPKITQDITLQADKNVAYSTVLSQLESQIDKSKLNNCYINLSPISIYQSSLTDKNKNYSFRLEIASYDRTLTDKEVNKMLDLAASKLHTDIGVKRI